MFRLKCIYTTQRIYSAINPNNMITGELICNGNKLYSYDASNIWRKAAHLFVDQLDFFTHKSYVK